MGTCKDSKALPTSITKHCHAQSVRWNGLFFTYWNSCIRHPWTNRIPPPPPKKKIVLRDRMLLMNPFWTRSDLTYVGLYVEESPIQVGYTETVLNRTFEVIIARDGRALSLPLSACHQKTHVYDLKVILVRNRNRHLIGYLAAIV